MESIEVDPMSIAIGFIVLGLVVLMGLVRLYCFVTERSSRTKK